MPKKWHQARYSKPQSTAPASLISAASSRNDPHDDGHERGVNQILADLRRAGVNDQEQPSATVAQVFSPTVPPSIRAILQLPGPPAGPPAPRRRTRLDARGRRLPPGPPPPRSWLSLSQHASRAGSSAHAAAGALERRHLPGIYRPLDRSLVGIALWKMAVDWEFQRSYNIYHIYSLPSHLREALISQISLFDGPRGLSALDLKLLLLPQSPVDPYEDGEPALSPSQQNEGITHLDLTGSVGRSIHLRELANLLFPPSLNDVTDFLQDTWDKPAAASLPRPLLPDLTHLSLARGPESTASISWKQLLSFSAYLPTLTHLCLAYWPEPTLTPNAKYASVLSAQGRALEYGGTSYYSHTLDNDWSEAVLLLRKLGKNLYGLEYLDLTGCLSWCKALMSIADGDRVDWVGDWGKITNLVLHNGCGSPPSEAGSEAKKQYEEDLALARTVERHIRAQRAGRGRFITVETDNGQT